MRRFSLTTAGFAALLGLVVLVGHFRYSPGLGRITPIHNWVNGGDEPHYLLAVNSLLFDHDLDLRDDYGRVARGGIDAGVAVRGIRLDHHTILLNPITGEHALWAHVFDWSVRVACATSDCVGFRRITDQFPEGSSFVERPTHPPAFAAMAAALIAPLRPRLGDVEELVWLVNVLACWLGACFAFAIARRAGLSRRLSWLAVLILLGASPWLLYSRVIVTEPLLGATLAASMWALLGGHLIAAGLLLSLTTALKMPFLLVGVAWIAEAAGAGRRRDALVLAASLGAGVLPLFAFQLLLARTPVISGGWVTSSSLAESLTYTFFHPRYGLFLFVPWLLLLLPSLGKALRSSSAPPLWRALAFASLPFALVVMAYAYQPGSCYGPRFWVPFMPLFAVAATWLVQHGSRNWRRLSVPLFLCAAAIAIPAVVVYPYVWDRGPLSALSAIITSSGP